jgi:hypothetical protein
VVEWLKVFIGLASEMWTTAELEGKTQSDNKNLPLLRIELQLNQKHWIRRHECRSMIKLSIKTF